MRFLGEILKEIFIFQTFFPSPPKKTHKIKKPKDPRKGKG